jgi:Ricin-type beta-trefoil lectin domain/Subtilase family/Putative Ig domain
MPVQASGIRASRLTAGRPVRPRRILLAAAVVAGLAGLPASAVTAASAASQARPARDPGALAMARAASAPVPAVPATARFAARPRIAAGLPGVEQACATPTQPGQMACMALVRPAKGHARPDGTSPTGYSPQQFQAAYGLSSAAALAGNGESIAIVDAYNDPDASSDLAVYRSEYGLPACGSGCLTIANEYGGTKLPKADPSGGWELEESTDLDVVSAICPKCSILLVEADSNSIPDLATAVRTASRSGANVVSNSWGSGAEFIGESKYDPDFYAPGVAITAAGGDDGYGTQYPAASPYVTSVGGTSLVGSGTSWTQSAWGLVGSGCSLEPKPSWQTVDDTSPDGCQNRTQNDVSADADPSTGAAVYDTVSDPDLGGVPGWTTVGGTSVSTPIIAGTYALADIVAGGPGGALIPNTFPAAYPYQATSGLTDVVGGSNGKCEPHRQYLCNAVKGFDGPTGLGTPSGTAAFTGSAARAVTITDPGPQVVLPGAKMYLLLDALPGTETLTFTTSPRSLPGSMYVDGTGTLQGDAPSKPGVYRVTVSASLAGSGTGSTTFSVVVLPKMTVAHPGSGEVRLDGAGHCLTDAGNSARAGTAVRTEGCSGGADQKWSFVPGGGRSGAGTLRIHSRCLQTGAGNGSKATIQKCGSTSRQQWTYLSADYLRNAATGGCLAAHGSLRGKPQAVAWTCGTAGTSWELPAAPVLSGVAGRCLSDPGNGKAAGTRIEVASCSSAPGQRWGSGRTGTLTINGKCLAVTGGSMLDGAVIELGRCTGALSEKWLRDADGELMNASSGRCLAAPGSAVSGTELVQDDCYSLSGEIWLIS